MSQQHPVANTFMEVTDKKLTSPAELSKMITDNLEISDLPAANTFMEVTDKKLTLPVPPELSKMITDNLERSDLPAVRLVNRQLREDVTPAFAANFVELKVFLSRRSLNDLAAICAHPVFGPHVKRITFASQRLLDMSKHDLVKYTRDVLHKKAAIENSRQHRSKQNEQETLQRTSEGQLTLTTAFEALKKHGNPVSLRMTDTVDDSFLGHKVFCQGASYSWWETARPQTIELLMEAAVQSGIVFEGFSLDCNSEDVENIRHHAQDIRTIIEFSRNLKSFEISFSQTPAHLPESCMAILKMLQHSPALEDVRLCLQFRTTKPQRDSSAHDEYDFENDMWLDATFEHLSTDRLRRLDLSHCFLARSHAGFFEELYTEHADTLRELKFSHCELHEADTWSKFMVWICQTFESLEMIEVEGLRARDDDGSHAVLTEKRVYRHDDGPLGLHQLAIDLEEMEC